MLGEWWRRRRYRLVEGHTERREATQGESLTMKGPHPMTHTGFVSAVLLFLSACSWHRDALNLSPDEVFPVVVSPTGLEGKTNEELVDLLVVATDEGVVRGSVEWFEFIAVGENLEFADGAVHEPAFLFTLVAREIVRRGADILPLLIRHLSDSRPTKHSVSCDDPPGYVGQFSESYAASRWFVGPWPDSSMGRQFSGRYVLKVADLCYFAVGQIVNRHLPTYMVWPTANLYVFSPLEAPRLQKLVAADWGDLTKEAHRDSLLADLRDKKRSLGWSFQRLRFYYPEVVRALRERRDDIWTRIVECYDREKGPCWPHEEPRHL